MRQKLTLITLGVADVARAAVFYEAGLGWKRSGASMDTYVLFNLGGMVLGLHPRQELAADAAVADDPTGFSGITLSQNATSEAEVDEALAKAEASGAAIVKPAQKASWGGYSGYFKDLDGHLIEIAYNPFWKLDEQGNLML